MTAPGPGRAVFLFGSARPMRSSTSEALGGYLMERLERGGMSCRAWHVSRLQGERADRELVPALDGAHLFVVAAPVYVDSLPYLVTHCLERVHAHRVRTGGGGGGADAGAEATRFLAIVNCGLPQVVHTETALEICRAFSHRAGFEWVGGLGLGGGEAIHGTPLEQLGRMGRHVRASLDATATALLEGRPVPAEAVAEMARPLMPAFVYTLLANAGWVMKAHRHGSLGRLKDQPLA